MYKNNQNSPFSGKKIAILGFGLEGKDVFKFLSKKGALISIFDQKSKDSLDLADIDISNANLYLGNDHLINLSDFDFVVRSPGFYRYSKEIVSAEKKGVKITSATQIFFDNCQAKIIGVTGTKGKGTTASLIYEILKEDKKNVFLAGNIGNPYLELLESLTPSDWVVMEMSSFQLIDLEVSPHISVVLNITSDHMDWHSGIDEYVNAKSNIVKHQTPNDFAVINADYDTSKNFDKYGLGIKYYFSKYHEVGGVFVDNNNFVLNIKNKKQIVGKTDRLVLRGKHNWENISAAICASYLAGSSVETIINTVENFKGLEHRLEFVGETGGVKFYNDSFATGPDATLAAVRSFEEPETVIMGGSEKGHNFDQMAKEISDAKNILNVILIGDISKKIEDSLIKFEYQGNIINMVKPSMDNIVDKAFALTKSGGVVVLSPAAASFDMFKNYKDRGVQFKNSVTKLVNEKQK